MVTAATTRDQVRVVRGLRWLELGRSGRVAWGRCQGSASQPYETVVSAAQPSVTGCSCPSRQRPCKHARGLAELAADRQIVLVDEPAWVASIADRRPFSAGPTSDSATAPAREGTADPDAAAKRAEARRERVDAGMVELRIWLADQVRGGLADLPRAGYGHFDAIAARMVDAQAPGVAGILRSLPADLVSADWPSRALHILGGLQLLAEAHARLDDLPEELAATVRSRIGYSMTKDAVRARPPVVDRWWAMAAVDTIEVQLTSRRVWLRGLDSGRWARWQTYAPPGRDLDTSVQPGRVYACAARFYPGGGLRVLIEPPLPDPELPPQTDPETRKRPWAGEDIAAARAQLAAQLSSDPWAGHVPVVLAGVPVPPRHPGDAWRLRDAAGASLPLVELDGELWPLLAQSGGEPVQLMGEYDGRGLRPLAVLSDALGRRDSTVLAG